MCVRIADVRMLRMLRSIRTRDPVQAWPPSQFSSNCPGTLFRPPSFRCTGAAFGHFCLTGGRLGRSGDPLGIDWGALGEYWESTETLWAPTGALWERLGRAGGALGLDWDALGAHWEWTEPLWEPLVR